MQPDTDFDMRAVLILPSYQEKYVNLTPRVETHCLFLDMSLRVFIPIIQNFPVSFIYQPEQALPAYSDV